MSSSKESGQLEGALRSWVETRPVWLVGAAALVAAAVVTEVYGLVARAIDIPMEAGSFGADEASDIFVGAFTMSTFTYGIPGIILAVVLARWTRQPARTWTIVALVALVLSLGGPAAAGDTTTATKVMLGVSHFVAAAVIIPPVALRLSQAGTGRENPAAATA